MILTDGARGSTLTRGAPHAFVGPEVVMNAVIEALEGCGPERWAESFVRRVLHKLGLVRLRLSPADAFRAQAQLEDPYQRLTRAQWHSFALPYLDIVLRGTEGATRSRSATRYPARVALVRT